MAATMPVTKWWGWRNRMSNYKEIFLHKQDLLRNRPDKCRVETTAESHLVEGFRSEVKTRDFKLVLDQPDNMGSTDQGPRPSECCSPRWLPATK